LMFIAVRCVSLWLFTALQRGFLLGLSLSCSVLLCLALSCSASGLFCSVLSVSFFWFFCSFWGAYG
jgi:uncharacterized membrane protein YedE/YeeE